MRAKAWRGLLALSIVGGGVLLTASPSSAKVTQGPCNGSAIIGGKTYTPANDTTGNPVKVPKTGVAQYHGDTGGVVTAPHHGHLAVQVGPIKVTIYSWASANDGHKIQSSGSQDLKKAYDKLGPFHVAGLYKMYGYHYNNGALFCTGFVYVQFDESPLSTPIGIAVLVLAVLAAVALLLAARGLPAAGGGRKGRPFLGAFSGLLLGAFVALLLQQFSVRPLDNVSVIGLPGFGLVAGIILGLFHPLGLGGAGGSVPPPPPPPVAPPAAG